MNTLHALAIITTTATEHPVLTITVLALVAAILYQPLAETILRTALLNQ